ncbi:MAG: hypothetical protein K2X47_06590, partial [Bdellovibrionales bacterium]|nr:hypothetical protein [Bdellovibrionales bacterium]
MNLSQISKLQMVCREVAKSSGQKVNLDQQRKVLQRIQNLKESATDLVLAQEFQTEIKVKPKTHVQRDESVRIEMTFTKEEMEILRSAQALLSNKTGGGLKESFVESAKCVIKSHQPKPPRTKKTITAAVVNELSEEKSEITTTVVMDSLEGAKSENAIAPAVVTKERTLKSVTPRLRREVRQKGEGCQFRNPET